MVARLCPVARRSTVACRTWMRRAAPRRATAWPGGASTGIGRTAAADPSVTWARTGTYAPFIASTWRAMSAISAGPAGGSAMMTADGRVSAMVAWALPGGTSVTEYFRLVLRAAMRPGTLPSLTQMMGA